MVVGRALDGGCRALGEVSAHPRSIAEDAKNAADGGEVVRIRMAEDHHIVRKEGYAGGRALWSEASENTTTDGMLDEGIEHVDEDREKHRGDRIPLV